MVLYDVLPETAMFSLIVLEARYPARWGLWYYGSGLMGFATRIEKACLIASLVDPWTPIRSHRDCFNAVSLAIINAI